jgi:putative two-component system response regulator
MSEIIALNHHEKWDGTGYPNGKKHDDIPIIAQITSICDVFDALTTRRPYKKAWSIDEAVAEIQTQSGKAFDPKLVIIFRDNLPEILKIKDMYKDE